MPQLVPIAGYNSITTLTGPLIVTGGGGIEGGGAAAVYLCVRACVCVCVCVCAGGR